MEVEWKEKDKIMIEERNGGMKIKREWELGIWGKWKVKWIRGEKEMKNNGGIREEEIEEGYIIECWRRKRGRVEIDEWK